MSESVAIYQNASLYVGDLDPDVTEAQLYERFSTCGPIVLAKICRDKITRQSLSYAYVNFNQPADAERALDTLNFEPLNNRPMRIMWSNRDPALRRSGVGNVFIKNLDKSIDNKSLYDTFSTFGNIISCKIMCDENGSKGYGFVHFETQEAAEKAIQSVNNMLLNGKKVFVGNFLPKQARTSAVVQANLRFTNVFVKNFGELLDDEKLADMFAKFGEITSAKVSKSNEGNPTGFGFVNFRDPESAAKAVQEMNETVVNDKKLFVGRFQKKSERMSELKRKYEEKKLERLKKYQGINLFVKNLDDKIDDERLKKEFSAFGNITSAKVMWEQGRSKGFGFVCFSAPEEATKAVAEMNGRIVGTKPLYVALAQRKEDRRKILTAQFRERMQNNQFLGYASATNPGVYYTLGGGGNLGAGGGSSLPARYMAPATAASLGAYQAYAAGANVRPTAVPRWQLANFQRNVNENLYGPQQAATFLQQQQQPYSIDIGVQQQRGASNRPQLNSSFARAQFNPQQKSLNANNIYGSANQMVNAPNRYISQPFSASAYQQATQQKMPRFKPNQPIQQQIQQAGQVINVPGQEPLTIAELSAAPPQQQKQMLGERLYPLIYQLHQDFAGKITGMLLEIDNAELLHMLDSPDSLKAKVDEALTVLQTHHEKMQQQQTQQGQKQVA